MNNRTIHRTALSGRLFLCPEIVTHHARPPPGSVQAINQPSKGGQLMYYHTCPYCGANLDPTNAVTASPASVEIPKVEQHGRRAGAGAQEVRPCPHLNSAVSLTASACSLRRPLYVALSPCGPARSPERRYPSPSGISLNAASGRYYADRRRQKYRPWMWSRSARRAKICRRSATVPVWQAVNPACSIRPCVLLRK